MLQIYGVRSKNYLCSASASATTTQNNIHNTPFDVANFFIKVQHNEQPVNTIQRYQRLTLHKR